jgi:hypothetical protein
VPQVIQVILLQVMGALTNHFYFRCHIRIAAIPVARIFAFQDPYVVVWPGSLRIPYNLLRMVTGKSLGANLSRDDIFDRPAGSICDGPGRPLPHGDRVEKQNN